MFKNLSNANADLRIAMWNNPYVRFPMVVGFILIAMEPIPDKMEQMIGLTILGAIILEVIILAFTKKKEKRKNYKTNIFRDSNLI